MEPIAIVTAFLGALYIVGRGPLLVAPTGTVDFYRRMYSTTGRGRAAGVVLAIIAPVLIVTAVQARPTHGDVTNVIQVIGWIAAVAAAWVIIAPEHGLRLANKTVFSASKPALRFLGALNIAVGLALWWLAFFVF